ncbi:hypothetical protein B1756_02180 [Natrarchaeobaculum aegyptiacum]|uniref:Uncharacterized protein n=2 Tax=Natrarchaeobaculum aegyptiacum TaxID=745377 RepID=A0A2Z2HXK6_9EURY|nr:hypothetical protein B1756_02180 [Natrarchaeobaculum aegyptiacum]
MTIGCPSCGGTVSTSLPSGPGIVDPESVGPGGVEDQEMNRLRGTETTCRNCGHELEWYYY